MSYPEKAAERIASIEVYHITGAPTTYHVDYVTPNSHKRIMRESNLTIGAREFMRRRYPSYKREVHDENGDIIKTVIIYVR